MSCPFQCPKRACKELRLPFRPRICFGTLSEGEEVLFEDKDLFECEKEEEEEEGVLRRRRAIL